MAPISRVVQTPELRPTLHRVAFQGQEIAVYEYAGRSDEPAVVLLHGFPDNHHLYDRLLPPLLAAQRRVITLDFIGWGASSKPAPAAYPYSHDAWTAELDAVVAALALKDIVLVVHDASGPTGVDYAMRDADKPEAARVVRGLMVLNAYYNNASGMVKPTAIWLFSTPATRPLAAWGSNHIPGVRRAMYSWQVSKFFADPALAAHHVPQFFEAFKPAFPAFLALNAELNAALAARQGPLVAARAAAMSARLPVSICFGAADPCLHPGVARAFKALLPGARLQLLEGAGHYPQMDQPGAVAEAILALGSE